MLCRLWLYTFCSIGLVITIIAQNGNSVEDDEAMDFIGKYKQDLPFFVKSPSDTVIQEGESASIDCVASGNPQPKITWNRDRLRGFLQILNNNSLFIRQAKLEDTGSYSCIADNGLGQIFVKFDVLVRVDGGFGDWFPWSPCDASCGPGFQVRERFCNNPPPRNGGAVCVGENIQKRTCNGPPCDIDGGFGLWSDWLECSRSCGVGRQYRFRLCDSPPPTGRGRPCGENEATEVRFCNHHPCGIPRFIPEILGTVSGNINGFDVRGTAATMNITQNPQGRVFLDAALENLPETASGILRDMNAFLAPVHWGVAHTGDGQSGIALSNGGFSVQAVVRYETGEVLNINSKMDLIPGSAVPMLDMTFEGSAPTFSNASEVRYLDFVDHVVQVNASELTGTSKREILVDQVPFKYEIEYSIRFNARSRMNSRHRIYTVSNGGGDSLPGASKIRFSADVSATASDDCPSGLQINGPFCQDVNECLLRNCQQRCTNTYGSFRCSCVDGFRLSSDGLNCEDENECLLKTHTCSDSEVCVNLVGRFRCVDAKCSIGLTRNANTGFCEDVDECLSRPCKEEQDCRNVLGSYECVYQPCLMGFVRNFTSGQCEDVDECSALPCPSDTRCVNEIGRFRCEPLPCAVGFQRDLFGQCIDADECLSSAANNCTEEEMCKNLLGTFTCEMFPCLLGFTREGRGACVDINECLESPRVCGILEHCQNEIGSYFCVPKCEPGFIIGADLTTCDDVNECANGLHKCPEGSSCLNFAGSYQCLGIDGELTQEPTRLPDQTTLIVDLILSPRPDFALPFSNSTVIASISDSSTDFVVEGTPGSSETRTASSVGTFTEPQLSGIITVSESDPIPLDNSATRTDSSVGTFTEPRLSGIITVSESDPTNSAVPVTSVRDRSDGRLSEESTLAPTQEATEVATITDVPSTSVGNPEALNIFTVETNDEDHSKVIATLHTLGASEQLLASTVPDLITVRVENPLSDEPTTAGSVTDTELAPAELALVATVYATAAAHKLPPEPLVNESDVVLVVSPVGGAGDIDSHAIPSKIATNQAETLFDANNQGTFRSTQEPEGGDVTPTTSAIETTTATEPIPPELRTTTAVDVLTALPSGSSTLAQYQSESAEDSTTESVKVYTQDSEYSPASTFDALATTVPCGYGYYRDENGSCSDINECEEGSPCQHFCSNTEGAYICSCKIGYVLKDDGVCEDFDECSFFKTICGAKQCINMVGTYICVQPCLPGFRRSAEGTCVDIDECLEKTHNCDQGKICMNRDGGYRCVCPRGYRLLMPSRECVDINECSFGIKLCDQLCLNTVGSYTCSCYSGFYLDEDGRRCSASILPLVRPDTRETESQVLPKPKCESISGIVKCVCENPFVYDLSSRSCQTKDKVLPRKPVKTESLSFTTAQTRRITTASPLERPRTLLSTTSVTSTPPTAVSTPVATETSSATPATRLTLATIAPTAQCPSRFSQMCDWKCESKGNVNQCLCPDGYRRFHQGRCRDIDECNDKAKCDPGQQCFNTRGGWKCVNYTCPYEYEEVRPGLCEKSCFIHAKFGYCRRSYVQYHTIALAKNTAAGKELITLRANTELVGNIGKAQFYVQEGNTNFIIKPYDDRAVLQTARLMRHPGDSDVVVVSDVFDAKMRLVCRTKFVIYITIGEYEF